MPQPVLNSVHSEKRTSGAETAPVTSNALSTVLSSSSEADADATFSLRLRGTTARAEEREKRGFTRIRTGTAARVRADIGVCGNYVAVAGEMREAAMCEERAPDLARRRRARCVAAAVEQSRRQRRAFLCTTS